MAENELDLYPEERNKIVEVWSIVQKKYGGRPADSSNLLAMANEAEQRMREIGFHVVIDTSNFEVGDDGQTYRSPIISIESRVNAEDAEGHDHERHSAEVQSGFLDGKVGTLKADGTLGEAGSKLMLPGRDF